MGWSEYIFLVSNNFFLKSEPIIKAMGSLLFPNPTPIFFFEQTAISIMVVDLMQNGHRADVASVAIGGSESPF